MLYVSSYAFCTVYKCTGPVIQQMLVTKFSRAVKMHNTSVILVSKYWFTCFLYAVEMHSDPVIQNLIFIYMLLWCCKNEQ
jgi:hypothetical protein